MTDFSIERGSSSSATNAARKAALDEDYAALGARAGAPRHRHRGADHAAVMAFGVAMPTWGVGTGGTRFARFPGPGEPRNIFDKLEDCAVIQQLARATPTVSLHFPWDKVERLRGAARDGAGARPRLRRGELQHLPGSAGPGALLQVRLALAIPTRPCASRRSRTTSNASRSASKLGSKALTVWIGDGSNFPGQSNLTAAFDRYLECDARDLRGAARRTGGCSSSTSCTSRRSIRR